MKVKFTSAYSRIDLHEAVDKYLEGAQNRKIALQGKQTSIKKSSKN
jgi:hypothetical protein